MCSAVVLLEAPPSGGRTVVTDRDPSDAGDAGAAGFVAENAERGLLLFDGRLLHGVLPGRPSPRRRTSLMLSFWDRALARAAPGGRPAANMALPAADGGAAWARALLGPRERRAPPPAEPEPAGLLELAPLWVPVDGADGGDDPPPPSAFYMGPPTWRPLLFEGQCPLLIDVGACLFGA